MYPTKKYKKKTRITNKLKTRKIRGGEVIDSGGFGCIFKPALKCKDNENRNDETNNITKLMLSKYAKKEYNDIIKYTKILEKIPNYSNFFLIDGINICHPDDLSSSDLINFNEKCSALKKKDFVEQNINNKSNLNKLMALNIPYGGLDIDKYIKKTKFDPDAMKNLNKSLINLLLKGILPMNSLNIYHCDIKDSNILINDDIEKTNYTNNKNSINSRLIDWGLSTIYKGEKNIPKELIGRPFQYNLPFSNILFTSDFKKILVNFLKENKNPDYSAIRGFTINYVLYWNKERGIGHLKTMNSIIKKFYEKDLNIIEDEYKNDLLEFNYTYHYIFEYITQILFKYIKNGKLDLLDYFNDVFLKNIDVWGFTTSYISFADYLINKKFKSNNDNNTKNEIIEKIKKAFLLVIDSSTEPININKLTSILEELNPLFDKFSKHKEFKKISDERKSNEKTKTNNYLDTNTTISRNSLNKKSSKSSSSRSSTK